MSDEAENSGLSKLPAALLERQWKPGQSGNPGGRPKGLARRIRDYEASLEAEGKQPIHEVLASIIYDTSAKNADRIAAAKLLWERAHGKAPLVMSETEDGAQTVITDAHILAFLEKGAAALSPAVLPVSEPTDS